MITALLVIGILVLLIVIHELGHFIAAKIFGVRVEEFGVGYPPRAFLIGKWGDTEYTLNWLPFGGFVRLFGDEGDKDHGPHSFISAKRPVQAIILVAGVFANIVLAWFLFAGALSVGVPRAVENPLPHEVVDLIVADVLPGSPADAAGIITGDQIIGLQDEEGVEVKKLTPQAVLDFIDERPGEELVFSYMRAGTTSSVVLRPAQGIVATETNRPAVGVALVLVSTSALPFNEALIGSFWYTIDASKSVGQGLWKIISDSFRGNPELRDVVGPVGLVSVVSEAATHGAGNILALAGFISVNLAIINLFPIPALDGGRLVLVGVEAVMRRRAPRFILQSLNILGFLLIGLLMIIVTYQDIARLF